MFKRYISINNESREIMFFFEILLLMCSIRWTNKTRTEICGQADSSVWILHIYDYVYFLCKCTWALLACMQYDMCIGCLLPVHSVIGGFS